MPPAWQGSKLVNSENLRDSAADSEVARRAGRWVRAWVRRAPLLPLRHEKCDVVDPAVERRLQSELELNAVRARRVEALGLVAPPLLFELGKKNGVLHPFAREVHALA